MGRKNEVVEKTFKAPDGKTKKVKAGAFHMGEARLCQQG
jgi:hypothetical protein